MARSSPRAGFFADLLRLRLAYEERGAGGVYKRYQTTQWIGKLAVDSLGCPGNQDWIIAKMDLCAELEKLLRDGPADLNVNQEWQERIEELVDWEAIRVCSSKGARPPDVYDLGEDPPGPRREGTATRQQVALARGREGLRRTRGV